jgi:hypothetical protein
MNHLTGDEVLQVIDGSMLNGEKTRILAHLETCPRCRREVEFSRNLERAARSAPLSKPSRDFTARVMGRVAPQPRRSVATWFINNLANILAMALVLTVVWYAVTMKKDTSPYAGPTVISNALSVYSEYYAKARNLFPADRIMAIQKPVADQSAETNKVVLFTVISILILAGVDRLVVRRVTRFRG